MNLGRHNQSITDVPSGRPAVPFLCSCADLSVKGLVISVRAEIRYKTTSLQEAAARMSLNSSSPETVDRGGSGLTGKGPPRALPGSPGMWDRRGGRVLAKPGQFVAPHFWCL